MIVAEFLAFDGRQYHRGRFPTGVLLPHPTSFDDFVVAMGKIDNAVTAAPELLPDVVNHGDGYPFRLQFPQQEASEGASEVDFVYGLIWINPTGLTLSPEVYDLSESRMIAIVVAGFPGHENFCPDWNKPGQGIIRVAAASSPWERLAATTGIKPGGRIKPGGKGRMFRKALR